MKEPRTGGQIQPQTLKGSVAGNTDLDNYILSSRVAPDTTDADVHALCKTGCIKDGGKRKILKGFPKETIELSEEQPKPADIK